MDAVRNLQTLSHEELLYYAAEMVQQATDFKQSEAALRVAYDQLETQVEERTAEMERLNQALAQEVIERLEAEKLLLEERRLLHILMENIPDTIYLKDAASCFIRINQAQARVLGVDDPHDALGKSDADFQDPELVRSFMMEEERIITLGQSVVNREEFNPTADGTPRWFSSTKMPITDSEGHVIGIVGISRDITHSKQVENALRASEAQFRSTFQYAAIGMALVGLDGKWLQVNHAVCEIVGYSEPELLIKTFQEITHPDDLDSDLQYVGQLLAGQIQSYQMEKRYFHKLGHEVWVLLSVSLVRDSEGKPLHFISQIQNVTERKRTEAALQETERHLRLLAQNSPDVIYIMDLTQQRASYLNRTEFLGYSQNEIEESGSLLQAIHPEDKERVLAHWQAIMIAPPIKDVGSVEYRLQDKQGQWQWIQSRETIFASTADGKPSQILVTLTVITEQKRVQQQARELQQERQQVKMLSDFVKNTSHDFRTPLSIISSSLYLLSKSTDPEKQKRHFGDAEKQITHLTYLLERLQEMGRLDSLLTLALQPLDVNQLILDLCAKLSFQAKEKTVTVVCSLWESRLMVQADFKELSLALAELGKNALGYTPLQGTITIRTRQQANEAVIEVCDTGIGIPSTNLPHIFERLYRVDESRSLETGGTGLGLSMAKRIIDLHHGSIVVESLVGEGSLFRIFLPLSS